MSEAEKLIIGTGEALQPELKGRYFKDGNWERMGRLLGLVKDFNASPSHDHHHIGLTLEYADRLRNECQDLGRSASWEPLFAAICIHDLGRVDPSAHELESIELSLKLARPVLEEVGYKNGEIERICRIVQEHDQPGNTPTSLEATILKEADFLAGMGAWGILRILVWGGECRRSVVKMINVFENSMRERIGSLQLPLSKEIAWKEWPITRVFLAHLRKQFELSDLEEAVGSGEYIVFEGTSGSGKETQAALLAQFLQAQGRTIEIVSEPSDLLRQTLNLWKQELGEVTPEQRAHLMTADRVSLIGQKILPALRQGKTVIGIRSWISTMVYQGESEQEIAEILLMNSMVPRPKAIFWLSLPPEEALARVEGRLRAGIGTRGDFEKIEKMRIMAGRYDGALKQVCPSTSIITIDASGTPEQVSAAVLTNLKQIY